MDIILRSWLLPWAQERGFREEGTVRAKALMSTLAEHQRKSKAAGHEAKWKRRHTAGDEDLAIPGGLGVGDTEMRGLETALWMLGGNAMSNSRMKLVQLRNCWKRMDSVQRRLFWLPNTQKLYTYLLISVTWLWQCTFSVFVASTNCINNSVLVTSY